MKRESQVRALFRRHRYIVERVKHGKHWKVWASRNGRTRRFVVSVSPSDYRALKNPNADRAGDLAQHLLGASNVKLSSRHEPRWGNHGSFSVIVDGPKAGVWRDHETNEAGDMLALIMRERRCDFANALKFGREFVGNHSVRPSCRSQPPRADREQSPDTTGAARWIWRESVDPHGSSVERYLASRDLPLQMNSQTTCCTITARPSSRRGATLTLKQRRTLYAPPKAR
jgi:hypothetical protein